MNLCFRTLLILGVAMCVGTSDAGIKLKTRSKVSPSYIKPHKQKSRGTLPIMVPYRGKYYRTGGDNGELPQMSPDVLRQKYPMLKYQESNVDTNAPSAKEFVQPGRFMAHVSTNGVYGVKFGRYLASTNDISREAFQSLFGTDETIPLVTAYEGNGMSLLKSQIPLCVNYLKPQEETNAIPCRVKIAMISPWEGQENDQQSTNNVIRFSKPARRRSGGRAKENTQEGSAQ